MATDAKDTSWILSTCCPMCGQEGQESARPGTSRIMYRVCQTTMCRVREYLGARFKYQEAR